MDWITILNGALGAGAFTVALKLLDHYFNLGKAKAETRVLKSEESENITEAAQVAVNIMQQALAFKNVESKEYQERVRALEAKQEESAGLIQELQDHRDERGRQIKELTENNDALNAQIAALQKQIEKDTRETEALRKRIIDLEERYGRMKRINEKLVLALQDANVPLPDMNGDLTDSVKGLKWRK